jgi:transposase
MGGENVRELLELIKTQVEIIKRLEARIRELEGEVARLKKDSGNSSKPPSSNIVKPKKADKNKNGEKRKIGAQRGHKKHERLPFSDEQIDGRKDVTLDKCPCCGGELKLAENKHPEKIQQIKLVLKPL